MDYLATITREAEHVEVLECSIGSHKDGIGLLLENMHPQPTSNRAFSQIQKLVNIQLKADGHACVALPPIVDGDCWLAFWLVELDAALAS